MKQEMTPSPANVPGPDELAGMMIDAVLTRWPETAVTFYQHHMGCVGCAVAGFYTIAEAVDVYGLPLESFLQELEAVIRAATP